MEMPWETSARASRTRSRALLVGFPASCLQQGLVGSKEWGRGCEGPLIFVVGEWAFGVFLNKIEHLKYREAANTTKEPRHATGPCLPLIYFSERNSSFKIQAQLLSSSTPLLLSVSFCHMLWAMARPWPPEPIGRYATWATRIPEPKCLSLDLRPDIPNFPCFTCVLRALFNLKDRESALCQWPIVLRFLTDGLAYLLLC